MCGTILIISLYSSDNQVEKIRHKKIEKNIEIKEQGQMEWNRKWNRRDKKQKNVKTHNGLYKKILDVITLGHTERGLDWSRC